MKNLIVIILIASTGMFACKKSEQAMGAEKILPSNPNNSSIINDAQDIAHDLKISFISKGEGIDHKLQDKVDAFLISYNKDNKTSIIPQKKGWGREGEIDYYFTLENLSTSKKKEFISSIEEIAGSTDMAHITYGK